MDLIFWFWDSGFRIRENPSSILSIQVIHRIRIRESPPLSSAYWLYIESWFVKLPPLIVLGWCDTSRRHRRCGQSATRKNSNFVCHRELKITYQIHIRSLCQATGVKYCLYWYLRMSSASVGVCKVKFHETDSNSRIESDMFPRIDFVNQNWIPTIQQLCWQ